MIPSRRTVLPGAHGNDAAPTFNLRLSNIYQKWELHFIQIRTKFWKQRIYFPNIKSVSVIIYLYVWKVKRSYGVSWLYLDSIDKVGFALKTLFMKLHTSVTHDLRRTLAILGTRVKFKLGVWTLHRFSTHYPPSFVKQWRYFTNVANDPRRTHFYRLVRNKRSRPNLDI